MLSVISFSFSLYKGEIFRGSTRLSSAESSRRSGRLDAVVVIVV